MLCVRADSAGIKQDHVSILLVLCLDVAFFKEQTKQSLAIADIHLASQTSDEDSFCHNQLSITHF
jgi:hypothetical protein